MIHFKTLLFLSLTRTRRAEILHSLCELTGAQTAPSARTLSAYEVRSLVGLINGFSLIVAVILVYYIMQAGFCQGVTADDRYFHPQFPYPLFKSFWGCGGFLQKAPTH